MDSAALPALVFVAFSLCFVCGGGLMMVAIFFLVGRITVKRFQQAGEALAEDDQTFFERNAIRLEPVTTGAFDDFSSLLEVNGQKVVTTTHYRGRIVSLGGINPAGQAYVNFDFRAQVSSGEMQLRTRGHRLALAFTGMSAARVQATVDEQPFGSLALEGQAVSLRDPVGRTAGVYRRHPVGIGGLRLGNAKYDYGYYYGDVELSGRKAAELNRNPLISPRRKGVEVVPLLRSVDAGLSKDEQLWLVLLTGWEVMMKIISRG